MGLLYIWTLLSGIAGMFVIWYIVFCYTNKVIATIFSLAILVIAVLLLISWGNKPTEQEVRIHTYKTLHI